MERQHIAYLLIAVMIAVAVALIAYARHNSRSSQERRRRTQEKALHDQKMAELRADD